MPLDKDDVMDAPRVDAEQGHLSQEEEAALYRHYGMSYLQDGSDSGLPDRYAGQGRTGGHDRSGRNTDDAMILRATAKPDQGTPTQWPPHPHHNTVCS